MGMPRTLPILDNLDDIRIASPCTADWNAMKVLPDDVGGDRGARARFCGSCEKNVYDLSAMTRVDALALVERHEGKCCVRFYKRTDGTVLTEDCPVGLKAALRRAHLKTLAGIAACAGAVASVFGFLLGTANPISKTLGTFEAQHAPVAGGMVMMGEPPMPETPTTTTPEDMQAVQGGLRPVEPPHVKMGKIAAPRPPKAPKAPTKKPAKPVAEMGDVLLESGN